MTDDELMNYKPPDTGAMTQEEIDEYSPPSIDFAEAANEAEEESAPLFKLPNPFGLFGGK